MLTWKPVLIPFPGISELAREREKEKERQTSRIYIEIAGNTLTPHDHATTLSRCDKRTLTYTRVFITDISRRLIVVIENSMCKLTWLSPPTRVLRRVAIPFYISRDRVSAKGFFPRPRQAWSHRKECLRWLASLIVLCHFLTLLPPLDISAFSHMALWIELSFNS